MVSVNGMTASKKAIDGSAPFRGFPTGSVKFLASLKKNNRREWFQPRKQQFEELLQAPLLQLARRANEMLEKNAPEYAMLEPAKALNRIYRDIRFSADKTPYQTQVSLLFPNQRLGKKVGAALYFSLSQKQAVIAAGMYFGETRELQAVRERLADKHAEFRAILAAKPLKQMFGELSGDALQKTPKQFGAEHAAADLLKRKQWLLMTQMPADAALEESFGGEVVKAFRLLIPFIRFLNAPLQGLTQGLPDTLR
jgi:uncharacterized protein (TIGR02453 family)